MLLGCELRYDESVSQSVRMPAERERDRVSVRELLDAMYAPHFSDKVSRHSWQGSWLDARHD